jgi:hypothetical protein
MRGGICTANAGGAGPSRCEQSEKRQEGWSSGRFRCKMSSLGRTTLLLIFGAMTIAIVLVVAFRVGDDQSPLDAEAAALELVRNGVAQESRRDGDRWEVDVIRADGSMVQVNLGDDLELLDLDEEMGPGGTLADDELRGATRLRAVEAAFEKTGPGQVVSVERDSRRRIKVRVLKQDGTHVGVVLDGSLRPVGVDDEDPRDE